MRLILGITFFLASVSLTSSVNPLASYNVIYGWKTLDFKFPSEQTRNRMLSNGDFIQENNVITGIKVYGKTIFLTVPRWRKGVPASLVSVPFHDSTGANVEPKGPLLNPFPTLEMNALGNCNALQYVQSMEIDQFGRMWAIDVGRVNIFGGNRTKEEDKCPPKLVLIQAETGEIVRKYEFPKDVVSPTTNFLNDIAVACFSENECRAYITDALDARIVVYNFKENRSWFVHHPTMLANQDSSKIRILDGDYQFSVHVDGLALSPKDSNFDRLYYCPLSSKDLYSVPTSVLDTAVNGDHLSDSVIRNEGVKSSQTDGLIMDSTGLLYYGLLGSNGVAFYNTSSKEKVEKSEVLLIQNDIDIQWPDTFAFSEGYLYTVTNRLQKFRGNNYDPGEINFRVVRVYTGTQSYMHSALLDAKRKGSETLPPSLYDATPKTNQDDDKDPQPKQGSKKGSSLQDGVDTDSMNAFNSTVSLLRTIDPYTKGILIFILIVYIFHPVA